LFGLVSVTSVKFEEFAFSGIIIVKKNRTKTDIAVPTIYMRWIQGVLAMMRWVRLTFKVGISRTKVLKIDTKQNNRGNTYTTSMRPFSISLL